LAAQRGIATICQKPFGRTHAEARDLVAIASGAKIPLAVHENFRFMPHFREMKRLLDAGQIGAVHSIAFRLRPGDGQGPRAYLERQGYFQQMPRLLVFETAIHLIDTFRYLIGEVVAVSARLRRINPVIKGEDAGYIVFEFAGGATGLFDGNRLNDHVALNSRRTMGECWLEGSGGVLRLDGDARLYWKPHQQPEAEHPYDKGRDDTFGGGACDALQAHVVRHLREGAPLENSAADYLANMLIQEAVYASDKGGRRIEMARFNPE
jgi:predicted dehydrogenase